MALNGLLCADVPLRTYTLTHNTIWRTYTNCVKLRDFWVVY